MQTNGLSLVWMIKCSIRRDFQQKLREQKQHDSSWFSLNNALSAMALAIGALLEKNGRLPRPSRLRTLFLPRRKPGTGKTRVNTCSD
ncbi:hypothetical protein DPMN_021589 [Dreissena polymorpha]|uniref:Uncharacterized protein n=1 Tax=Dreissena polymorpha TaxID=45954 RepID=A0A9D4NN23_DREPO|nr:hypothetical protein DPMN_021589 [Dreissena polymorpha]